MSRNALIVGINNYRYLPGLKAPSVDAEAISHRLERGSNFKVLRMPERIDQEGDFHRSVISPTQTVNLSQLEKLLEELFLPNSKQAPDTALFYFSGHGLPDQKGFDMGYLATSDTHPQNSRSGLSLRWMQWLLSKSPVKQQIIFLDCCHSGSLIVDVATANPGYGKSRDRCFIASSRSFESSWEDLNSSYSVLTKALLDGLDPTRVGSRAINTSDLVAYINQALKGELQTPVCTNFGEAIELIRACSEQPPMSGILENSAVCPYKGLSYFEDNNHDYQFFYGRKALTDELLDKVRTSNFIAITGASGSGKSSLIRAGLLHQIRQGRISGSENWNTHLLLPGKTPCLELSSVFVDKDADHLERTTQLGKAEALITEGAEGLRKIVKTVESARVIIVIDQFEEIFTLCQKDSERQHFLKTILGALKVAQNKLCIVLAMRSDFMGRCFEKEYYGLAEQVRHNLVPITPMTKTEVIQSIEAPARQVGLNLEPELVKILISDIEQSPSSLPLLQYTLKTLWETRKDNTLRLTTYIQLGGITNTLKQKADKLYEDLDEKQKLTVKHIFLNLTQLGEGAEDTRRRVSKSSLITAQHSTELVNTVLKRLTDTSLIVTSELIKSGNKKRIAVVDVAHESLIRNWPRLRQWLNENRDLLRQQRSIERAAEEWQTQEQMPDYLLRGRPLLEASRFREKYENNLPLSNMGELYVLLSLAHRKLSYIKLWSLGLIIPLGLAIYTGVQISKYFTEKRLSANLSETNLRSANLSEANLSEANLRSANLSEANLSEANLRSANFSEANLSEANLRSANFSEANLINTNFNKTSLTNTNFNEANLDNAFFLEAFLVSVNMEKANLHNVKLSESIILSTDLRAAKMITLDTVQGDRQPFLCNSPLPKGINISKDRDCEKLVEVLIGRYSDTFRTFESAESFIEEQQKTSWD